MDIYKQSDEMQKDQSSQSQAFFTLGILHYWGEKI